MWGTVSWPQAQRLRILKGLWTTAVFQEQSSLNISYQKINDLMGWNDCRMDAAAFLHFLRRLPASFCLLFCLWLVQCYQHAESSGHTDGQGWWSPSHLYLVDVFSIRFLKLGMELFAILLTGFKSASCLLCSEKSHALMIKSKNPVASVQWVVHSQPGV